jgi:hypothetical protein
MHRTSLGIAALALSLCATSAKAVSDVWAFDLRAVPTPGGRMLRFPVNAPAQNVVIPTISFDTFAMDFNSAATTLYAVSEVASGAGQLGTIDLTTGAFAPVSTIVGDAAAEASFTGLKVDPTNEAFYLSSATTLYKLNPATGLTTAVNNFTGGPAGGIVIEIAIDKFGQMYGHEIGGDNLYRVDKNTAAMTLLGPTGFASNFAQGMDFDYDTNTLYATIYTGGGVGAYVSFNTTTGAATTIASTTTWNAEMEMAIASQIPEPASLWALALGGMALARRRR